MNISPISMISKSPNFRGKSYGDDGYRYSPHSIEYNNLMPCQDPQEPFEKLVNGKLYVRDGYGNWYNAGVYDEMVRRNSRYSDIKEDDEY